MKIACSNCGSRCEMSQMTTESATTIFGESQTRFLCGNCSGGLGLLGEFFEYGIFIAMIVGVVYLIQSMH